jgi:ABC-type antimicrobial peptide transport system permease subunit
VLVNDAYMQKKNLKLGAKIPINGTDYTIVGTVKPTLTGETADIYFPLATLQNLAGKTGRVTQIFVSAKSSGDVDKVATEIKQALPGAEVLTSKELADQASGSLADAHKLADNLGGALAIIVLIAAFVIAALLTLSSIGKRVREIGTLRAIGWSKGRVVRQLVGETMGIAVIGAAFGLLIGGAVCWAINQSSTTLKSTSIGVPGATSGSAAQILGAAQAQAVTVTTQLHASLSTTTLLLGIVFALIGGLIAGLVGSWRAARLAPAEALRDIG